MKFSYLAAATVAIICTSGYGDALCPEGPGVLHIISLTLRLTDENGNTGFWYKIAGSTRGKEPPTNLLQTGCPFRLQEINRYEVLNCDQALKAVIKEVDNAGFSEMRAESGYDWYFIEYTKYLSFKCAIHQALDLPPPQM